MCGIAGFLLKTREKNSSHKISTMLDSIRQRGPDDEGVCLIDREKRKTAHFKTDFTVKSLGSKLPHFKDKDSEIKHDLSFIQTRYSIIDLSEGAHQPFVSHDKSLIGIFNGEIYNYIELREKLKSLGVRFKTTSDTEVLIEGYQVWQEQLWEKMNGFWAVVLYDLERNKVIFSRDRIGVAPLYYREMEDGFYFASSLQPLIDMNPGTIRINRDVILGFAQTGIKDHDHTTFYTQIKSLPELSTITFHPDQFTLQEAVRKKYWDLPQSRFSVNDLSFSEAVEKYRENFFNAVKIRLRADVKVAFELSGGLDSSSIVAAAALQCPNDITTYTARVFGADEEPYARSILKKYAVDYHVVDGLEGGFEKDYGSFSRIMEEPYDNPNDYTHYKMLKRMKKQGVSVVITGAGGDEILAGYESSFWPKAYEELKKNGFHLTADWYEFCRRYKTLRRSWQTIKHYILDLPEFIRRHLWSEKKIQNPYSLTSALKHQQEYKKLSFHEQTLFHFNTALVPYYMRSSDHFTMGIPVEHRFPLLDYRMVELCLQMPITYLFKNGWTKYLLRKAMKPYLPRKILWRRKKMGFAFPYRRYFSENISVFKPLLGILKKIDFPIEKFGTYEQLLKTDPVLLWRLCSLGIWIKNLEGMIKKI